MGFECVPVGHCHEIENDYSGAQPPPLADARGKVVIVVFFRFFADIFAYSIVIFKSKNTM